MKRESQIARHFLLLLLFFSLSYATLAQRGSGGQDIADTASLDVNIANAEAKASSPAATDADKHAVASAYLERGNVYYNAQAPRLYKFALADFRRALKYQPDLAEAREKIDQMESIYRSMNRPIPQNGAEPPEKLNETAASARRIELKTDPASALIKDVLDAGSVRDYAFTVEAAENVSVSAHSEKQVVHFNLYRVRDGALIRWALDVDKWEGEIKPAGTYVIRVGPAREKSEFTLEVKSSKSAETRKF
ncbi:MAG: hypothetical protein QOF61_2371 [Acidobacteriota bacterium]|nr:hypothetical protein [Acidobacteriota bacterium]